MQLTYNMRESNDSRTSWIVSKWVVYGDTGIKNLDEIDQEILEQGK